MAKVRFVTRLDQVEGLPSGERPDLERVSNVFPFRSNTYYLGLIDWSDANDPIRRIIIPSLEELVPFGRLDASFEGLYAVAPSLEHKYADTAVLLANDLCGGFCRFCFRKRLFMEGNAEVVRDLEPALAYIRRHSEIRNVLVTGGDPLLLSTSRLRFIMASLRENDHVRITRIGSQMPAFNPHRIIDDPGLVELLGEFSTPQARVYLMTQFNHPRELTEEALSAIDSVLKAGVLVCNQTPLLRGVNSNPRVLAELLDSLAAVGAAPYYIFQVRPTVGNAGFGLPLEESYRVVQQATEHCSGLAKRVRLVMSHASGKVELVGLDAERIYLKYHRAARQADQSRFFSLCRNPDAHWLDEYEELPACSEPGGYSSEARLSVT